MSSSLLIEKDLSSSQHYTRTAKEIYFPNDLFVFIFLHKSFDTTLSNMLLSVEEDLYSTALNLTFKKKNNDEMTEIDLVVLDLNERAGKKDVEILVGECKTGQHVKRKQIDSLVGVKELLENSGIRCHLLFARTKKKFTNQEIEHFRKLVARGIKPILFTANELEPWLDLYKNYKTVRANFQVPIEYPFTFAGMAENSAYIYDLR